MVGKTIETLLALVNAGAWLDTDCAGRTQENLVRLAVAASRTKVRVTMRNMGGKSQETLIAIVNAGGGFVTLAD